MLDHGDECLLKDAPDSRKITKTGITVAGTDKSRRAGHC